MEKGQVSVPLHSSLHRAQQGGRSSLFARHCVSSNWCSYNAHSTLGRHQQLFHFIPASSLSFRHAHYSHIRCCHLSTHHPPTPNRTLTSAVFLCNFDMSKTSLCIEVDLSKRCTKNHIMRLCSSEYGRICI